jgi:uncharacterized surface protein with fasciclin (FAS1) repeats
LETVAASTASAATAESRDIGVSRRGAAKVVKTDIVASNPVVHVIHTVILPEDKQAISWTLPFC